VSVHHIQRPAGGEPAVATNNQPVSEHGALGWLPRTCFRTGPSHRTGLELELQLMTSGPAGDHVPTTERITLMADLHTLPLRSRLTVEPGGQIELSSPPADDVAGAAGHLGHDLALVRRRVEWHCLRLVGSGLDPCRAPRRVLEGPRYAAMETYFDRRGVAGRLMMCSTA